MNRTNIPANFKTTVAHEFGHAAFNFLNPDAFVTDVVDSTRQTPKNWAEANKSNSMAAQFDNVERSAQGMEPENVHPGDGPNLSGSNWLKFDPPGNR